MRKQNFDLVERIGTRVWLQAANRYNHMMDLIGFDVFLNDQWKFYFNCDPGWHGTIEDALKQAKNKLIESEEIVCVYNSIIDGDMG